MKVLEIGCGGGRNLLELILLGFKPANLVGIELLADRVRQARASLPDLVRILEGDACSMGFADGSFDVVLQSTVFTSILDDSFQQRLANEMWRCVAPGGAVLWYDFTFNNPSNPDVRGVPVRRVAQLFPEGNMRVRRVTLAPPLSRRVCRRFPLGYQSLNLIPWLRSHVLCWIGKTPR
jgi:SAM-dependent methyltransferase